MTEQGRGAGQGTGHRSGWHLSRHLSGLIRAPALHFIVLGALLFAADIWWRGLPAEQANIVAPEPLVISAGQIDRLRRDFILQNRFPPTAEQLRTSVEEAIDEEIFYRAALANGLDRDNDSIRRRLVQLARFVSDDPDQDDEALYRTALELGFDRSDQVVRRQLSMIMRLAAARTPMTDETPPDDAELAAYLREHPERFAKPWRAKLTHVYLSGDKRGAAARKRANKLLGKLRAAGLDPQDAPEIGDPFLLGHHLPWRNEEELAHVFGGGFANAVAGLAPGAWSEPIKSNFGWHLVWLDAVESETVPDLAEVRDAVLGAVLEARERWRVEETLKQMRAGYRIEVEWPREDAASGPKANADG